MSFEHRVQFIAAFDKRPKQPGDPNYGVHGVEIRFGLIGELGAVSWVLFTGWMLPEIEGPSHRPIAAGVCWHGRMPSEPNERPNIIDCEYLNGPCYDAGVTFLSDDVFEALTREGEAGVWRVLEEKYHQQFDRVEQVQA